MLECVNPVKQKWRVRWDVQQHDDGQVDYMEEEFDHRPSHKEVHDLIVGWYNSRIDSYPFGVPIRGSRSLALHGKPVQLQVGC